MSIKYNNKVIAGNITPTSYRFVGEIFQSAIPIDDPKVHLLDGSLLSDTEGYKDFIQHLSSLQTLYPQLFCTEEVWQEKVTQYGEWGQFVLSSNGVRLPKITSFVQGLNSLTDLATLIEAGLPNIEAFWITTMYKGWEDSMTGAVKGTRLTQNVSFNTQATTGGVGVTFDASNFNSTYGNSTTVQPQAIRYPYYIVIATGVVQNIQAIQNIEFNNPFFFGMSQYFETEPNNLSWLKSVGQWNMKSEYPDYYNWVLSNTNNSIQNFKLSTDIYTDYDFVVNITDETFRLPLVTNNRILVSKKEPTNDDKNWYNLYSDGWCEQGSYLETSATGTVTINLLKDLANTDYSIQLTEAHTSTISDGRTVNLANKTTSSFQIFRGSTAIPIYWEAKGYTEIPTVNDYTENVSLYYYMGETVQNVSLINAGKVKERITRNYKEFTDLKQLPHIIETYINGTSWYRVYSDGWCEQGGHLSASSANAYTVTFLKPFKDTNISILQTDGTGTTTGTDTDGVDYNGLITNLTTSSFRISIATGRQNSSWEAKGYIF